MRTIIASLVFLFSLCSAVHAHGFQSGDISIGHPHARPAAGTTGEVYLTLMNMGAVADALTGVSSPKAKASLWLYDSATKAAAPIKIIDLLPMKGIAMRPGGSHVRLDGLAAPLAAGDKFPLELTFKNAPPITVLVMVEGVASH